MDTTSFVRAIDGDTLETWINTSRVGIGIIGIDAPEGNTICGIQATDYIQELVYGGLHLEEDPVIAFDQAFRRMYYAYTPSGESVAALMAASGLVDVTGEGKEADLLQALHAEAEATQTGCFADPDADLNTMGTLQGNLDAAGPSLLQSTILPPDLAQDTVVPGLSFPTSFSFFPDGRILIGEKSGLVHVFKDGALLSTPFIDIRSQVNNYWDRGLLNVAVDPNFDSNGYVYLLYTYENNASEFSSAKTGRLIRVTANGDTASLSTAVTLLGSVVGTTCPAYTDDCIPSDSTSHSTGGIAFGADGTLFVTLGDGAEFNVVDPNALRAQHPDSLAGKLLRITNAGQGLPDNPFFTGDPNDNRSKVWASGLRNAYRLSVNPANGVPYLGDVGWNTWEETSAAPSGSNLGWPCYEGPALQGGYESYSECKSLYALGSTAVQPPLVYWNHNGGGSAVTGGVFIDSDKYSAPYRNAYLYADYVAGSISYIHVDANNAVVSGPSLLASNAAGPVDFEIGPDGYLYYLAINTGEVRRITPVDTLPEPGQDVYVSDLAWLSAKNG